MSSSFVSKDTKNDKEKGVEDFGYKLYGHEFGGKFNLLPKKPKILMTGWTSLTSDSIDGVDFRVLEGDAIIVKAYESIDDHYPFPTVEFYYILPKSDTVLVEEISYAYKNGKNEELHKYLMYNKELNDWKEIKAFRREW